MNQLFALYLRTWFSACKLWIPWG